MLFEVQDLSQASPATVSRCGMVYVDSNELKWMPYVVTWAKSLLTKSYISDEVYEVLLDTFKTYVEAGLEFTFRFCSFAIHQVIYYILHIYAFLCLKEFEYFLKMLVEY